MLNVVKHLITIEILRFFAALRMTSFLHLFYGVGTNTGGVLSIPFNSDAGR
ncbi:hypothetical protein CAL7102_05167 [Dulcicalothrix desertica PCC 7102]|nr:hypothetical protein CAL7102_05167 [Dulcicalothrix desertica PCC 7102]